MSWKPSSKPNLITPYKSKGIFYMFLSKKLKELFFMFRGLGLEFRGPKSYYANPYPPKTKPLSPKHVENLFNILDQNI